DGEGRLLTAERIPRAPQPARRASWTYDEHGRPASVVRESGAATILTERWTWSPEGRLVRREVLVPARPPGDLWELYPIGLDALATAAGRDGGAYVRATPHWAGAVPASEGAGRRLPTGLGHGYAPGEPEYTSLWPAPPTAAALQPSFGNPIDVYGSFSQVWYG